MAPTMRCAVIGCGVIAPTHLECLRAMPDVEVAWVCDKVEARARALAGRYGVANVAVEAARALADAEVDAVHVCTDHASHAELACAALAAGKHVLVEKPLAADAEGVGRLVRAARRHPDRTVAPVLQHRHEPAMEALRRIVQSGLLGRLATAGATLRCHRPRAYYQDEPWRGRWATEGGSVLINQAVHFFDLLLHIAGAAAEPGGKTERPVASVQAMWANRAHGPAPAAGGPAGAIETEDTLAATLQMTGGAIATFEATSASHLKWEASLALHGTSGSLEWRDGRIAKLEFAEPTAREKAETLLREAREAPRGPAAAGKGYYGPGHPALIADFIGAIREKRPPMVTLAMAETTMGALFAAYESARTGQRATPLVW